MRKPLLLLFLCVISVTLWAQANAPIMVEGSYSAAASSPAQMADTMKIKKYTDATMQKVEAALISKDYAQAIIQSKNMLDKGIDDPRIYTAIAYAYEKANDFTNAKYYANQAIAKRPSDAQAYTIRASCYQKEGDLLRAKEDIDVAISLNPKASSAVALKDLILADIHAEKIKKRKNNAEKETIPSWFYGYVACVVLVIILFIFMRYRGLLSSMADEHGRKVKEVNIKEQYNFIRPIGEGGMGKVYEAYDNVLKRKVAVKRIRPELLRSSYVREQFLAEARLVAMLRHPCVVEIYTVIETTNSLYLVFEFVEGQTLETRLDIDNYIPYEEARDLFGSICKGLSYAHSKDIVHCDLKPGNIMICDSGIAKVMDFGVAKQMTDGEDSSRTVAGTPAYMSPEQQKGFMSKQSDIYSLAVCLYEALVGQVPWSVKGYDIATKKIVPPSDISPYIPAEIDALIEKSLEEDPAKRIQSVTEFWSILKKAEPIRNKK